MEYLKAYWLIIRRECLIGIRKQTEIVNPLLFFIIVTTLFPLASTPNPKILKIMGPGVIWVAVLLATLLSLTRLFQEDYSDGSLEQFMLSTFPLPVIIFAKVSAQWLMLDLPIIILSPLIAVLFQLSWHVIGILIVTLLLGTPILCLLGSIAAAITVGLRNSGLLLAIVLLPLYIPILIFSTSAVMIFEQGLVITTQLAILGALFILALTMAPFVAALALRVGVNFL